MVHTKMKWSFCRDADCVEGAKPHQLLTLCGQCHPYLLQAGPPPCYFSLLSTLLGVLHSIVHSENSSLRRAHLCPHLWHTARDVYICAYACVHAIDAAAR